MKYLLQIKGNDVIFDSAEMLSGKSNQFDGVLRIDEAMRVMDSLPKE